MVKRAIQFLVVALLVTETLWAANDPFVGKWKLNPSKSTLTDTMKVTAAGENKYGFDFGAGKIETIVVDGTDQPGIFGTTLAVTVERPDTWKVVRKKDGRAMLSATWTLSQDGNTLRDAYKECEANGSTTSVDYVYKRTAAGSGFAGTWESTSEKVNSVYEIQIEPFGSDGLTFINPEGGTTQEMRFDGKDYLRMGKNVPESSASSGRRVNERALEMTDKLKDKITDTREIKLSPDLKTLTMTVHPAGQKTPNVLVFDRE